MCRCKLQFPKSKIYICYYEDDSDLLTPFLSYSWDFFLKRHIVRHISRYECSRNNCNRRENDNRPIVKEAPVKRCINNFKHHNPMQNDSFRHHNLSHQVQLHLESLKMRKIISPPFKSARCYTESQLARSAIQAFSQPRS